MMAAWIVALGVAGAMDLADVVQQQSAATDKPVLVCPVGPDAAKDARRLLSGLPAGAVHWQQLPVLGDPDREVQHTLARTGESCALRLSLNSDPQGRLVAEAFGDCTDWFRTSVAAISDSADGEAALDPSMLPPPSAATQAAAARASGPGLTLSLGTGYHHFTWLGESLGSGLAYEGLIGGPVGPGLLQARGTLTRGQTPEGVQLRKRELGIRYVAPAGAWRFVVDGGVGRVGYEGATGSARSAVNLGLGLGFAYTATLSQTTRLGFGPRLHVDSALSDGFDPVTGLSFMVQLDQQLR